MGNLRFNIRCGPAQRARRVVVMALAGTALMTAAQALTNQDIVSMVKAGLTDSLVITKIRTSACRFDTSPQALIALKKNGISDAVLKAMTEASSPRIGTKAAEGAAPVTDVGMYYQKGSDWVDLPPEVVNWRTGGVLKSMVSGGVINTDINGTVAGPHSQTTVTAPEQFLVYTREGEHVTEYQLVRLHGHKDSREFRMKTGGVFHEQSGAIRDLLAFNWKRIGPRTFLVDVGGLLPGEYGFLPPGAVLSQNAADSKGKIYTFSIPE